MRTDGLRLERFKKHHKIFLISALSLVMASCKNPPPRGELCLLGEIGALCIDERLPKGEQECVRRYPGAPIKPLPDGLKECVGGPLNYIATNPDDYDAFQAWVIRKCRK